MDNVSMNVGREMYVFFKYRYYIRLNETTTYYYSKSQFARKAFEYVESGSFEELKLENALDRLL